MIDVLDVDLWAPTKEWVDLFPLRRGIEAELALLERLFSVAWRRATLRSSSARHQLRGDLMTVPGRARLLDLAAELLRASAGSRSASPNEDGLRVPMQGRLRYWNVYEETVSEFLAAPILRPVGRVTWQPPGAGPRCDYLIQCRSGLLVAEVKRVRTSKRHRRLEVRRTKEFMARLGKGGPTQGPLLTAQEHQACEQEDAPRLYRRIAYAAKQLAGSARHALPRRSRHAIVPGAVFLDVHENTYLLNLRSRLHGWMELPWARPIDLVVCFYYGSHDGVSGTIAAPFYSRSHAALDVIFGAHAICRKGHIHLGGEPSGGCTTAFGL